MFNKHSYTCPDVIYLRNRHKKVQTISIAVQLATFAGLWAGGKALERRETKKLENEPASLSNQE